MIAEKTKPALDTRAITEADQDSHFQVFSDYSVDSDFSQTHSPEEFEILDETVANDERQLIDDLLKLVSSAVLADHAGTLKSMFIAHLIVARSCEHLIHNAGDRRLAIAAGVTRETARKRNRDLEKLGFIRYVKKHTVQDSTIWTFDIETIRARLKVCAYTSQVHLDHAISTHEFYPGTFDLFSHRGLGKSAGEIWRILKLSGQPFTVKGLSDAVGCHWSTVSRALGKMKKNGMIEECAKTYRARAGVDLKQIADGFGVLGTRERRKRKYLSESKNRFKAAMTREQWLQSKTRGK